MRYAPKEAKFRQKAKPVKEYQHKVKEKFAKIDIRSIGDRSYIGKEPEDTLYIKWSGTKKLTFDDFKSAQASFKQLVPDKDTDLLKAVYPNYQSFYRVLDKRRLARGLPPTEAAIRNNGKLDSMVAGYIYSASFDAGIMFENNIDSPAASVLTISPALYAINDSTYYYNIVALFSKAESWMVIRSKDILQHEQIHFDIFELHARKLRKSWIELIRNCQERGAINEIGPELAPIYDQLYLQLYSMQMAFDQETAELTGDNKPLLELNRKWVERIEDEMEELEEYDDAEGIIVIR